MFSTGVHFVAQLTPYFNESTRQFMCTNPWDVTLIRGVHAALRMANNQPQNSKEARKLHDTGKTSLKTEEPV